MQTKKISIVGAGLIGSLLAIYLRKQGHEVTVFERRQDLRKVDISAGKSINLALSDRGWKPLKEVGLEEDLLKMIIPMKGRIMHDKSGQITFQPYGKEGQAINSISRGGLNGLLMDKAETLGVQFKFQYKCLDVDFEQTSLSLYDGKTNQIIKFDLIFGTDGAFSAVRAAMQKLDRFTYSQSYIPHGYKELVIPATETGDFAIDKNGLHIWPRGEYMLIALPNMDGSFTVTLFLPFEGEGYAFESLNTDEEILSFFQEVFPDALKHMPTLLDDFRANPASSLVTVKSYPWIKNNILLLGDAAHAVVPFYGQGMNCGFEDCFELNQTIEKFGDDWATIFKEFNSTRPQNANAIADLALENFVEMRDKVADENFLLRKKIEAHINKLYPKRWIPQYSMVTFNSSISYSKAMAKGKLQRKIMDKVMSSPDITASWKNLDFELLIKELEEN
ncbi:MAG: FAD-dependent monooxygenase [Cyclobacteriaceae bacterium]|nr:FAD-dependent monooxygenase [Cyclobacteriaceae bacterium]